MPNGPTLFDETELVRRLGMLPGVARVAFATACASRMSGPYWRAREEAGVDAPDLLAAALGELWRFVAGHPIAADWGTVADGLVEQIPDEERMTGSACEVLDDALAAAAFAARAAIAFDPREAASSARRLYNATDAFAQRSLDFAVYSPEIERVLLNHPVVQRELARQVRDLARLEAAAPNTPPSVLRARAEVETAF